MFDYLGGPTGAAEGALRWRIEPLVPSRPGAKRLRGRSQYSVVVRWSPCCTVAVPTYRYHSKGANSLVQNDTWRVKWVSLWKTSGQETSEWGIAYSTTMTGVFYYTTRLKRKGHKWSLGSHYPSSSLVPTQPHVFCVGNKHNFEGGNHAWFRCSNLLMYQNASLLWLICAYRNRGSKWELNNWEFRINDLGFKIL